MPKTKMKKVIGFIIGCAVAVILPHFVGGYLLYVLNVAIVYAIASFGMNILVGYTNQMSLGNGAFFGVGAYIVGILVYKLQWIPFLVALPVAGMVSAGLGFIIGLPSIRTKDIYLAIATLGFGLLFEQGITNWRSLTGGAQGMAVEKSILSLGSLSFESDIGYYYFALVIAAALLIVGSNLMQGKFGRSFRAIKDSEIAAQAMGINVTKYKLIAFVVSAFFTGVAGAVYAPYISYLSAPMFSIFLAISLLTMAVIGGLGSILGSILGAVFVILTPEVLRVIGLGEAQTFFYAVAMIIILIAFPSGVAGGVYGGLRRIGLLERN